MNSYSRYDRFYILLFFLSLLLGSCSNNQEAVKRLANRDFVNLEHGKGVEINYSQNGIVRIRAMGPTATRHNSEVPFMEFNDGIKILFFSTNRELESTLTAKYALAYENSKSMTARDSVVVVNKKGEILNTDELIWDEDKKIIYSNSFVKIQTTDEIIYGKGMTANENFTDYVIKNITGKIKVKTSELE
ncbi:MAG: LPS export ABC transporter periplasmic protein LptC [Bacteroidetes bacterium]|nr:LPS export ABC transporter periplasmic protein LptC [Bacteroidota bacterium]